MKIIKAHILITTAFFFGACCLIYWNPYFDWLTVLFFLLLYALQALVLFSLDLRKRHQEQKQVESLLHLLQDIELKKENVVFYNGPLGLLRDEIYKSLVEKREKKEQAIKARQLLKKNVEDITHQLKTPITGILLLLDLMKEDQGRQAEYLPKIQLSMDRLYRLTDLLLKLSSLEAGMVIMKQQNLSAISLISDAELSLSGLVEQKNQTIRIESPDIEIIGDRTWLQEAITNILKNAIEASPDNAYINIHFSENQIYRSIYIQDHGRGITAQQQKHIFERFYKADPESNGFGIGLPLAKNIMESHEGSILIQSDVDGTTFELRFYTDALPQKPSRK